MGEGRLRPVPKGGGEGTYCKLMKTLTAANATIGKRQYPNTLNVLLRSIDCSFAIKLRMLYLQRRSHGAKHQLLHTYIPKHPNAPKP